MNIQNVKRDLELVYDGIAEGVEIRSKSQWYKEGEKSTEIFLNLQEKTVRQSVDKQARSK